jgi:hypothetical protein
MANYTLKQVLAAVARKQADLDMIDDELMGMPEMAPDAPADMATSSEFDLLSQKREELESEISHMREGVELISQWEKFKGGPWSEEIKGLLGEIDIEISDIAGGEVAAPEAGMDMGMDMGMGAPTPDMAAPPMDAMPPAPEAPPAPAPDAAAAPVPAAPAAEPAPLEPPMASKGAGKSSVSEKNSYQSPVKKGVSARSDTNKEGSNMANPTPAKASAVQEKLAEVKSQRENIRREAQQRVAAAWTIAKTMLPTAPAEIQKAAAANLLSNPTNVLNAMLRQTAKNAHYAKEADKFAKVQGIEFGDFVKRAESFTSVHKKTMNDLMEEPSVLSSEKKSVESELKGDPKSASGKVADDRKDAGPQLATFDDGRCYPSKDTTPAEMHADSPKSQTEADHRPMDTINKSEGDKAGKEASAKPKVACGKDCKGCDECKKDASAKTACGADCKGCDKCEKKAAEKCADGDKCAGCDKCASAKIAAINAAVEAKKAQSKTAEPMMDAPPMEGEAPMGDMPPAPEGEMGDELAEPPAELPAEDPMAEGDTAGEVLSDEKKMVVEEKIEEAQEAIKALEQEILQEGEEELDLSQVFNEDEMEEKVSALANEGDEHTAGNGEEYFAPTSAESLEASLDEPQLASMEDFFSLQGSDSDPLAHLIAGEIRTAAEVAGMEVVPSFTGEAARHFESDTATGENRDNENDHDQDLFAEAIEEQTPEDGGFKRVKQDETNVLQSPKSAKKASAAAPAKEKAPVISKLKKVTASEQKPVDIASALLGNDEF